MAAPVPAAEDAVAQAVPELVSVGKDAPRPAGKVADGGAARSDHTDPEVGDAKIGDTMVGEAPSNESSSAGAKVGDIKTGEAQAGDRDTSDGQSKDPQFYFERGVGFYRNGDLDQALGNFNRAIRLDPTFASAYVNRSIVFYRKADVARAFADVARAARIKGSRKLASRPDRAADAAPRY
jgi:tetratricopeptide (TPR) repeat protein